MDNPCIGLKVFGMKKIFTLLLLVFIGQQVLVGQCDPTAGLDCEGGTVLCGLNELDGFSCSNPAISNPTGPHPLCGGAGTPENTQWWAFKGNGKTITISFSFNLADCLYNNGIEAGVLDDCGANEVDCNIDCNTGSFSLIIPSIKCHEYYLWVDGCDADVCDYTIDVINGEAPRLPDHLPVPKVIGKACRGGVAEVCVKELNSCEDSKIKWIIDGIKNPDLDGYYCIELDVPADGHPLEVCAVFFLRKNYLENCDERASCLTLVPDPLVEEYDGELFVCWEDHKGEGYFWRDTLIFTDCTDPPCRKTQFDNNIGCMIEYFAEITILDFREAKDVYKIICDKSELPFIAEDGSVWEEDVCEKEIEWSDAEFHNCDTSYILHLEIFDPKVDLTRTCPGCHDSIIITAMVDYDPQCVNSQITWVGIWVENSGDTIGYGDTLGVREKPDDYSFHLFVRHTNPVTGELTTCTVHDTSWHIIIKDEPFSILGDTSICQVDTSEFSLPKSYSHGCKIEWTLERGNGQIIPPTLDDLGEIKIVWPRHNTSDGRICAQYIDDCDSVVKVCFDLEGCVTTSDQNTSSNQWSIFPNPARDIIYIRGKNIDKTTIEMLDLEGYAIQVQPKQDISGVISIEINEMASGIYLIQLTDGEKKEVIRIVKL